MSENEEPKIDRSAARANNSNGPSRGRQILAAGTVAALAAVGAAAGMAAKGGNESGDNRDKINATEDDKPKPIDSTTTTSFPPPPPDLLPPLHVDVPETPELADTETGSGQQISGTSVANGTQDTIPVEISPQAAVQERVDGSPELQKLTSEQIAQLGNKLASDFLTLYNGDPAMKTTDDKGNTTTTVRGTAYGGPDDGYRQGQVTTDTSGKVVGVNFDEIYAVEGQGFSPADVNSYRFNLGETSTLIHSKFGANQEPTSDLLDRLEFAGATISGGPPLDQRN